MRKESYSSPSWIIYCKYCENCDEDLADGHNETTDSADVEFRVDELIETSYSSKEACSFLYFCMIFVLNQVDFVQTRYVDSCMYI